MQYCILAQKMSVAKVNNFSELEGRILKHLSAMRSDFLHPYLGIKFRAYQRTLDFIEANMLEAVVCNNRNEVFNYALSHLELDGIIAEFGVKSGKTINELANKPQLRKKTLYGFDSFIGIPEDWTGTKTLKGQLTNNNKLPKVAKNISLIKGWFKDTLVEFCHNNQADAALLHIDCDLYQSTKEVLNAFASKIKPGTVIIFDEFFNYPNWQSHEYKAWCEFIKQQQLSFSYLCYAHTQVAVKITA